MPADEEDDLDVQFSKKECCVDNALKRAKQWADYVREVCTFVEKMCALSADYHCRMEENMHHMCQLLKAESASSLPLQSYYLSGAELIGSDCSDSEAIFRTSIPQIVYEALRVRVKEHESMRKKFKNDWTATIRQWRKTANAMENARQNYYTKCAEVERAHSDYVTTNTRSTNLVLVSGGSASGGAPQLRGDPRHEAKLEKKKKYEEDCIIKSENAKKAYQASVDELNKQTELKEARKTEILRGIRELIEKGDQCFITATCSFFEFYTRTKESKQQELRSLSKTSHQNYKPGSKYKEFTKTCLQLDPDEVVPKFNFEEYNSAIGSQNRLDVNRKQSRGGSSGESYLNDLDEPEIEDEEDSTNLDNRETVIMTSTTQQTRSPGSIAYRVWSSTKDTASSFFHTKAFSLKIKKTGSSGLQVDTGGYGALHSPRIDVQHNIQVIARCMAEIEDRALSCNGIYRLQASKRRLTELTQALESRPDEVSLAEESPHTLTGLLKCHLLQLPDALLTANLYTSFIEWAKDGNGDIARLTEIVEHLPRVYRTLAGVLFHHLHRVAEHESENQMNSQNLSLVFAPTILRPKQEAPTVVNTASLSEVLDYSHQKTITETLITHVNTIFGPSSDYNLLDLFPTSTFGAIKDESSSNESMQDAEGATKVAFDPGLELEDIDTEDMETHFINTATGSLKVTSTRTTVTREHHQIGSSHSNPKIQLRHPPLQQSVSYPQVEEAAELAAISVNNCTTTNRNSILDKRRSSKYKAPEPPILHNYNSNYLSVPTIDKCMMRRAASDEHLPVIHFPVVDQQMPTDSRHSLNF